MNIQNNLDILTCFCKPKTSLIQNENVLVCVNSKCFHSNKVNGFKIINNTPVLISNHYCDTAFVEQNYNSPVVREKSNNLVKVIKKLFYGKQSHTYENSKKLLELVNKDSKLLIIGGGVRGIGTEELYSSDKISIISTDVYLTDEIDLLMDAHFIPFKNETFDAVWIQAVLEHVIDPNKVVSEIYRVLKKDGIVYAETPFMQQVHEGAYDITRFTVLGHRYLFRNFETLSIGGIKGVGTVLTWSIYYFFWSILRTKKIAKIISLPIGFFLNFVQVFADKRSLFDAGSGSFFLGKKSTNTIKHKDLIKIYKGMQ